MGEKIAILTIMLLLILGTATAQVAGGNATTMKLLGVGQTANGTLVGVIADLEVRIVPGSGHVYMDTIPLTKVDTQASVRLAKDVACSTLQVNCSGLDFFYVIRSSNQLIGGPSAGTALTVATMASLQGVKVRSDMAVTGTINPSGTVGPIGGLLEKAAAAKAAGITVLLIPSFQEEIYSEADKKNVNTVDYLAKTENLTAIPVGDIRDIYTQFTGLKIVDDTDINYAQSSDKLNAAMADLATTLYKDAQNSLEKAKTNLKMTTIGNKTDLTTLSDQADSELTSAKNELLSKSYYSTASYSVRSAIYSYQINNMIASQKSGNESKYVSDKIDSLNKTLVGFETSFIPGRTIDSVDDIEVFLIVLDRMSEAKQTLEQARLSYDQGDIENAMYLVSYAEVRKNTVYSWFTLIGNLKGDYNYKFDKNDLKDLALERIEQSKETLTYAEVIVGEDFTKESSAMLMQAETDYSNGEYVDALFNAAKSRAISNLMLELSAITNDTVQQKLDQLEKQAEYEITRAQEEGLVPILALSYLEFARTLRYSEPSQALIFMGYSKEMATLSKSIATSTLGEKFGLNIKETIQAPAVSSKTVTFTSIPFADEITLLLTGVLGGIFLMMLLGNEIKKKS